MSNARKALQRLGSRPSMLRVQPGIYEYRGYTILRLTPETTCYPKRYPTEWSIRVRRHPEKVARFGGMVEDVYPTLREAAHALDRALDGKSRWDRGTVPYIRSVPRFTVDPPTPTGDTHGN